MTMLILGIALFLGIHTLAMDRGPRGRLIARWGLGAYKAAFSLLAAVGLVLIVRGFQFYRADGWIQLWTPPVWTRHLTMTLMWFAFVSLACMNPAPGRVRGWLRHPMLVAVKIWALAHLLANGDLGGLVMFGSFLAWAVVDRIAAKRRGDAGAPRLTSFTAADAVDVGIGTVAYIAMLFLHPALIGVPVLGD